MIKYNTFTGDKVDNMEAREQKAMMLPLLKGMRCSKCSKDTVIGFHRDLTYGLLPKMDVCCPEFEKRINAKLR
jgi:hypothetical protein